MSNVYDFAVKLEHYMVDRQAKSSLPTYETRVGYLPPRAQVNPYGAVLPPSGAVLPTMRQ